MSHMELWKVGITSEIRFWSRWFETRGLEWPHDFAARINPQNPLDELIIEKLRSLRNDGGTFSILDVGSGPITNVGYLAPGMKVNVAACDPLADAYAGIRQRYGVDVPVQTTFAMAEELSAFFPLDSFDLVNCENALDHTVDPVRGIKEMLKVTKTGGIVLLRHARNEAENQRHEGLHQWNFNATDEGFVIWDRKAHHVVDQIIDEPIHVSTHGPEPAQVRVEINKTKSTTQRCSERVLSDGVRNAVRDIFGQGQWG